MGAGLQTSLGLRKRKVIVVPKKGTLAELLVDGFDIHQLIQEFIVPIDGIICTHHIQADGKHDAAEDEKERGHAQVMRINEMLRNLKYRKHKSFIEFNVPLAGQAVMMFSNAGIGRALTKDLSLTSAVVRRLTTTGGKKSRRIPGEVLEYHPEVCRVGLCRAYMYAAEIDSNAQQAGDVAPSRIEMTIHGYLFFPPFETFDRFHEDPPKKVLRLYPPEVELARSASKVAIQVPAYLHDPNAPDDILGLLGEEGHVSQMAPLRITCRHVTMARHSDQGGDPVLDAWLPVSDIERQIEFMLNEHMSEKLWHPD